MIPLWGMIGIWTQKFGWVSPYLVPYLSPNELSDSIMSGSSGKVVRSLNHIPMLTIHKGIQCGIWTFPGSLLRIFTDDDGGADSSRF